MFVAECADEENSSVCNLRLWNCDSICVRHGILFSGTMWEELRF